MKNITCWKKDTWYVDGEQTKTKPEGQPDYRLTAKIGEEYVDVGAGWIKETAEGKKFISFKLSDKYNEKPGFHLALDEKSDYPDGPKPEDIPF